MSRLVISIACNEQEADSIRKFAQKYFRQLHLRYKTERTYPESGWNTPAFGEAIWVYAIVFPPQGLIPHSRDLRQIVSNFEHSLKASFLSVTDFSTDFALE